MQRLFQNILLICNKNSKILITLGSPSSGGQSIPSGASCTPSTAPSVTNGQCHMKDELTLRCRGQRLSKSANCGSDQFCCFNADSTSVDNNQYPEGSSGQTVVSGAVCSPNTAPEGTNGNCRNSNELSTMCQGQRLSKSSQCASNQFCCFNGQATVTSTQPSGTKHLIMS